MGSPLAPNRRQYDQLLAASELATFQESPARVAVANGIAALKLSLPRQGVSLIVLEWE
jgi:hypothetical protein